MRRTLHTLLLVATAIASTACHGEAPETETTPAPASTSASPETAPDPRDQYALAHAIEEARRSYDDLEAALARTRAAWIDREYRWELAYVPALCGPTGPCVALPFDHLRDPEHPIRQGWLPRLELEPAQRRQLAARCEGQTRCVLDLSGRLSQLELSTERPPSLTLSDIEVHGARPSRDDESWILGSRRTVAARAPEPAVIKAG
ncbi:MAG: hypothetical protein H6712_00505 [Myxococcales bacterium]|nr:hypothetical protein [Myxococcales bacterium]MCB9712305.1 hypothetical protein [Myxococcales bacterium]